MKIINTIDKILNFANEYNSSSKDYIDIWRNYIKDLPEIEKICYEDMINDNKFEYVLKEANYALTEGLEDILIASKNFNKSVKDINQRLIEFCPLANNTELYFYFGLSNGAGWATTINGVGTILIGAEKVVGLKWHEYDKIKNLISHELAHETHRLFRCESIDKIYDNNELDSIWHLYIEGYGQRVQRIISGNNNYHQDDGKWLEYCINNENRLKKMYFDKVISGGSTNEFFGDWYNIEGYSDIGYYLGSRWIDKIYEKLSMEEIARLDIRSIKMEFMKFFSVE